MRNIEVTGVGTFRMFQDCSSLESVNLTGLYRPKNAESMFEGCTSLNQPEDMAQGDLTSKGRDHWKNAHQCLV